MEDKVKNELHEKRMNSKDDESFDFKQDDFEGVIKKIQGKKTKANDFITRGGQRVY